MQGNIIHFNETAFLWPYGWNRIPGYSFSTPQAQAATQLFTDRALFEAAIQSGFFLETFNTTPEVATPQSSELQWFGLFIQRLRRLQLQLRWTALSVHLYRWLSSSFHRSQHI
jgi:hypothetical protein